jgi:hypothetical protein
MSNLIKFFCSVFLYLIEIMESIKEYMKFIRQKIENPEPDADEIAFAVEPKQKPKKKQYPIFYLNIKQKDLEKNKPE